MFHVMEQWEDGLNEFSDNGHIWGLSCELPFPSELSEVRFLVVFAREKEPTPQVYSFLRFKVHF